MITYRNACELLNKLRKAIIKPKPVLPYWKWADENVSIPPESSGPAPGRLNTGRLPVFRGLFDLAQQPHVHFITLCASIRVGKTLFSIVLMLYWIAEKAGGIVWLDPSGASAKKVSRSEIDPFIRLCPPAEKLANFSRTTWTALWKTFTGKILRLVGSGEEANLHGFNAELAIINEFDRCKEAVVKTKHSDTAKEDSSSADKIIGRTQMFPFTRKIVENSSPGMAGEFSPIWQSFLRGSQHYAYLPCPHCSADAKRDGKTFPQPEKWPVGWSEESKAPHLTGWQRLTFSHTTAHVPFDENLMPIVGTREEKTGQVHFGHCAIYTETVAQWDATQTTKVLTGWDFDKVAESTTYECQHCKRQIEQQSLRWMLARYRWVANNPNAPKDRISAHIWRGYAPPELGGGWNVIAKQFLESKNEIGKLITFHNFTLGLPFIRTGAAITPTDIDRTMARTPMRYVKGQLPMRPEVLTITADKQEGMLYYTIRAWGILLDHPEQPTWSALVDWGTVLSMDELCIMAGEKPDTNGKFREFTFTGPDGKAEKFRVTAGLIDSGDDADRVYEFCHKRTRIFDPYKGAGPAATRWNKIRMGKVYNDQLDLWLCWSNHYAARLYYDCIKHGQAGGIAVHWWLPVDVDDEYKVQLTDEYQDAGEWVSRRRRNHLGDCEKMQLVISELVENRLFNLRAKFASKQEKAEKIN